MSLFKQNENLSQLDFFSKLDPKNCHFRKYFWLPAMPTPNNHVVFSTDYWKGNLLNAGLFWYISIYLPIYLSIDLSSKMLLSTLTSGKSHLRFLQKYIKSGCKAKLECLFLDFFGAKKWRNLTFRYTMTIAIPDLKNCKTMLFKKKFIGGRSPLNAPRKPSGFRGKCFWVTATGGGSSDFGT